MPKGYLHLAYEQRCQIYALLKRGLSESQISKDLKVAQSTINREIKRNKGKREYRYKQAHVKAVDRRSNASSRSKKMTPSLSLFLEQTLKEKKWSPEQISGRMKLMTGQGVSYERIYQYIWEDKRNGGSLYKNLRRRGKKYNKRKNKLAGRGLIPNRVGIEQRPVIVDEKIRVGDYEMDTIVGARHKGAIVSIVERKTKIARLYLLNRATAEATSSAIVTLLMPIKDHVHTITADNGKEFAQHEHIKEKLEADVYFARPYHAWERGLNENTNGLVRQYFPKNCDFTKLTQADVRKVEYQLNNRPRKSLNYQTPNEVFLAATKLDLNYALRC